MIKINLLPQELRGKVKARKPEAAKAAEMSAAFGSKGKKYILYLLPGILGLLLLIHLSLFALGLSKKSSLGALERKWQELEPQRSAIEAFNQEFLQASSGARQIQQLSAKRCLWSKKLNLISLLLPYGVWFNEIAITTENFTLLASAVAFQNDEMNTIKKFMDNLKGEPGFFGDFLNLQLGSVKQKTIGGYEVADFVLTGVLKPK